MEINIQFSHSRNRECDVQNHVLIFTCCVYILADYAAKLEELEKSLVSRPVMASGYESSDMPDMAHVSSLIDDGRYTSGGIELRDFQTSQSVSCCTVAHCLAVYL